MIGSFPEAVSFVLRQFGIASASRPSKWRYLGWLLIGLPSAAIGQRLEAVGGAVSGNITQTPLASSKIIILPPYMLRTDDQFAYDETGYRLAAYARWQLGKSRFFVQPEVAYTATQGQTYGIFYNSGLGGSLGLDEFIFGHHIRRWEIAGLGGIHLSRRTYVTGGLLVAFNQRENQLAVQPGSFPATEAIYNSLYQSVEPTQLLAQLGIGYLVGRFDFNLRLEQSLTPYTNRFTFDGITYRYRQQIRQEMLTIGFLLYKGQPQPVAERE